MKRITFGIIFSFSLLISPIVAQSENVSHVSEEYGFELLYSKDRFEELPVDYSSGIALALRSKSALSARNNRDSSEIDSFANSNAITFPTFTVSAGDGSYNPGSSTAHAGAILSEYHRAGFVDAKVVRVSRYIQRGKKLNAPLVTLLFSSNPLSLAPSKRMSNNPTRTPRFGQSGNNSADHLSSSVRGTRFTDVGSSVQWDANQLKLVSNNSVELPLGENRTKGIHFNILPIDAPFYEGDPLLRAKVILIMTPSRHFFLTYLDLAEREDRGDSRRLFDNFYIRTPVFEPSQLESYSHLGNLGRFSCNGNIFDFL